MKALRVPVWAWVAGGVGLGAVFLWLGASMMRPLLMHSAPAAQSQTVASQPTAPSGDTPQAIILAQLRQAHAALGQQGFQIVDEPFSGGLQRGQTWNVPAQLNAGVDYRVVGVCDRDCADLDLIVFDEQGATVTQDTSTSSQPVVAIQPGYSGTFTIQVLMYNCSVEPCYYAIALYGRSMQ
jgi:hypothetical protein